MKNLYEFLQPIFESFSITFPSKEEAIAEFQKRIGNVPEEIESIVEFLYDNAETGSYPIIFDNTKEKQLYAKIQRVNWNKFEKFIYDNLDDSIDEKRTTKGKQIVISGFTFQFGDGSVGKKYSAEGDTVGQYAESLVCYFFNNYKSIDIEDKNIQKKIDEIEQKAGVVIDDSWRKSIALTVEAINSGSLDGIDWNNSNYVAVHTDQKDIDLKEKWAQDIAKIYSGKGPAQKVLNVNLASLPNSTAKDTWNKADIILVKKDCTTIVNDIKNSICPIGSDDKGDKTDELNNILNSHVVKGDIIPISLKKITSKYNIKAENIPSESKVDIQAEECYITLPTTINTPGYAASMWLHVITNEGLHYGIQFRSQTDTSNGLSIESGVPGNKDVRGGKGVTLIKNELGITKRNDKTYLATFKDLSDMCNQLFNCGFELRAGDKKVSSAKELEKYFDKLVKPTHRIPIYERTCFAGFVGVYNKYCDFAKNVKGVSDQLKFATNVLNKCTLGSGTSSFFLIS